MYRGIHWFMAEVALRCNWWLLYTEGKDGHVIYPSLCFRGPWSQWWHPLSCTSHHFGDRPHADIRAFKAPLNICHFGVEFSIRGTAWPRNLKCYIISSISKGYNLNSGLIAQRPVSLWGAPQDCTMTNFTHMCSWWLRYPEGARCSCNMFVSMFLGSLNQMWHLLSCKSHHFGDRLHAEICDFKLQRVLSFWGRTFDISDSLAKEFELLHH